jgi:hypothetical protein
VSKDVELTEEERRIIAEMERFERDLRPRSRWGHRVLGRDRWAWTALALGTAVVVAGLVATLPFVPFVGFVIALAGATRLSTRIAWSGWLPRLRGRTRVPDSRARKDRDAA